jgi:hypothetical protein
LSQVIADFDPVEELFQELSRLVAGLNALGDASLALRVSEVASKSLLLAAASRFELDFLALIEGTARRLSGSDLIASFCVNQGLKRRYHSLFNWDARNANKFFSLFGDEFAESTQRLVAGDPSLAESVRVFLDLGDQRNKLVHGDFVSFPLAHSLDELIGRYRLARRFVDTVKVLFEKYAESSAGDTSATFAK